MNYKIKNIKGQRFGRLLVLEEAGRKWGGVLWKCLCDCGTEKVVLGSSLRSGNTKSCGCYRRERASETNRGENHPMYGMVGKLNPNYKHGLSHAKGYMCAKSQKYNATKLNQTPHDADLEKIQLYYQECAALNETFEPGDFEVDHIQPISKGGLHHENNLQIIEATLNREKLAKWPLTIEQEKRYRGIRL